MSSRPELKIDWCTHEAAKYAVEHWHYSKCMPCGKMNAVGVWEAGKFIGTVLFSRGANHNIGRPYGLTQTEVVELTRVALTKHAATVTRIVSLAFRFIKKKSPGIRLCVSYADPEQGHIGVIYQAGNWVYSGRSHAQQAVIHAGAVMHKRTAQSLFGTIKGMKKSQVLWKHKYLMPLDPEMRKQIEPLRKPYPKRVRSVDSDTSANHAEKGGANPTRTLSISEGESL